MRQQSTYRGRKGTSPGKRPLGQLWQVPTFVLGIVAVVFVAGRFRLLHNSDVAVFQAELVQMRQALDSKDNKDGKLQPWLEASPRLVAAAENVPSLAGEAYFLLGSLHWRLSEEAATAETGAHRGQAEEFFEKALTSQNVANWDQGQLKFRLGMILYRRGQDINRALQLMKEGLHLGADPGGGGCEVIVQAMLKQENPNLDEALKFSKLWLERSADNEDSLCHARMLHGELLMRCQRWLEARTILERAARNASREVRIKSLYLQAAAAQADGHMWRQAQKIWEGLLKDADAVPGGKGRVLYSLGLCALNNETPGEVRTAIDYFNQTLALGGEEAQAANLRLGEAQLNEDLQAALQAWHDALAPVQKPADYHNAYVALEQVRDMIEAAWPKVMDRNSQTAQKLADLYDRVALPPKGDLYRAQACEAQALKSVALEAAACFSKAAQSYEQAASTAPPADRTDYFWRAGNCFQQARQFSAAVRNLESFVKLEKNAAKLGQGWLALADSYAALNNLDKARQAFVNCTDITDNPSADRARYRLAQIERSAGNFDRALNWLKAINPRSASQAVVDDALFLHGSLFMNMARYDWAEIKLQEAIKKCPNHPAIWKAQSDLADCCRKLAALEKTKFEHSATEEIKEIHQRAWRDKLSQSAKLYQELHENLKIQAKDLSELSDDQLELLRLALFSHADILVELGDVDNAVHWYQYLQKNYSPQVESLIACERLWRCVPHIRQKTKLADDMPKIMRASLEVAETDLRNLDAASPVFRGDGVPSKQEWEEWINRAKAQLATPFLNAPPR